MRTIATAITTGTTIGAITGRAGTTGPRIIGNSTIGDITLGTTDRSSVSTAVHGTIGGTTRGGRTRRTTLRGPPRSPSRRPGSRLPGRRPRRSRRRHSGASAPSP